MFNVLSIVLASQLVSSPGALIHPLPEPAAAASVDAGSAAATAALAVSALDPATLEERGVVIRRITVRSRDIFDPEDPEENNRVYRLANRLHRITREQVIRRLLLFAPGDRYTRYRIEESERILRSQRYLYGAEIHPVAVDGTMVDLEVRTRDVWTLKAGLSLSRSGGANETKLVLQDSNFLGSGKELTLKRSSDVDRSGYLMRYNDPNLGGTRAKLELNYRDNDDGDFQKVKLIRPFYSLESRWAAGFQLISNDRINTLYSLGEIVSEFRQEEVFAEVWVGRSNGLQKNRSRRWLLGFTYDEDRFSPKPEPTSGGGAQPPQLEAVLPNGPNPNVLFRENVFPGRSLEDRKLTYPWVGLQIVENRYYKTHDLNGLNRTEDLEMGHHFDARLGWSSSAFGGQGEQAIFNAGYGFGYGGLGDDRKLLFVDSGLAGRFRSGSVENLHLVLSGRFYRRNIRDHTFFAALTLQAVENLDAENQLLLGGDTGLRGYPLRYQEGERRALLTLEQRFYTNWHPFHLAYVGAAVFVDTGKAWTPGVERDSDLGWLTNIGLGLRISPSRSGFGSMIHLDVALPLDASGDIAKTQWLVSSKETF